MPTDTSEKGLETLINESFASEAAGVLEGEALAGEVDA